MFSIAIIPLLCGCEYTGSKSGDNLEPAEGHEYTARPGELVFHLSEGGDPIFVFDFGNTGQPGNHRIERIIVRSYGTLAEHQRIDISDSELLVDDGAVLEIVDINFDGYNDFRYPLFRTAGPNVPYGNWIYDPTLKKFDKLPGLDDLVSPIVDATHRQILSSWRDGQRYGSDVYQFEHGELVHMRQTITDYRDDGSCLKTTRDMISGAAQEEPCQE